MPPVSRFLRVSLACSFSVLTFFATAAPIGARAALLQEDSASNKPGKKQKDNDESVRSPRLRAQITHPVLWHQPKNIADLDLFYGQGGENKQPKAPFTFESEDMNGTNPKFDVRDANDKKWRVKTGEEVEPEVAASRLLWAAGYYVNDDYVLTDTTVSGVHMKRGNEELKQGKISKARFSRKPGGQNKIGIWEWKQNPFSGSREFNGLRVMMAVLNNWDLKDVNNAVYTDSKTGEQIFLVSDVGASFGTNGVSFTRARSKGNLDSYAKSGFVQRLTETEVDFSTPKKPTGVLLASGGFSAKSFVMRKDLDWIGNRIPREDARWMGTILGQLTHRQIIDAFRAGHFPADQIAVYTAIVEDRIAELKKL